ncbi:MAG: DUF1732 domain-containing protein, partial [Betaproteobacteria bacterium]|nr:DUF1732 domain-containing protein [Betaproteobacteria bacterium]
MQLLTLGLNHQSAPLAMRERVAFAGESLIKAAQDLKARVGEELSRLQAHSAAVEHIIAQGGPCGKRLDFM